jgi:hypothetical protein
LPGRGRELKALAGKKSKGTALSVFKGREARLNRAILQIYSEEDLQAKWDVLKKLTRRKGFKHLRYAVVDVRMKALELGVFLTQAGERDTKQGGKTALYSMTAKAKLALELSSRSIDDLLNELDEEAALAMLRLISHSKD